MIQLRIGKKLNKRHAGFSLMEAIFSIVILITGILATVNLISRSIMISFDARNQLIATELAQEGVELVRNVRDNNWQVAGAGSFDGVDVVSRDCVDKDTPITTCNPADNQYKLYINSDGFYVHSSTGGTPTKFSRSLKIENVDGNRKVTSMVRWNGNVTVFPTTIDGTTCNTSNKCAYTTTTLSKWGGS